MEHLEFIKSVYLQLQKQARQNTQVAIATDSIRASLVGHIADITGVEPQTIQDQIESQATMELIASGKLKVVHKGSGFILTEKAS